MCLVGYEIVTGQETFQGPLFPGQEAVTVTAPTGKKIIGAFGNTATSAILSSDGLSCTFIVPSPQVGTGGSWTSPVQSVVCVPVYECPGV